MTSPALFIGVVSHEGSRFAVSQGPQGLAAHLHRGIAGSEIAVNTVDLHDETRLPITSAMVQATLTSELRLERAWAGYLGRATGPRWWVVHGLRWARRGWRRLRPPSTAMVRRLLNIELSHLDLMRRGLASGAAWVLVLEDDAFASDTADVVAGLQGLMNTHRRVAFINVSASFTPTELGIDHLLSPLPDVQWAGPIARNVLTSQRPATNTVCAILYSREFLTEFVPVFDGLPMEPVVPIDWKVNVALMAMVEQRTLEAGDCWFVEPAPITQMSMQRTEILPS